MIQIFTKLKKWIKENIDSLNSKRSLKNIKKYKRLQEKISVEMPFLRGVVLENNNNKSALDPWDQIKYYHEIKSIKSQKRNNWIIAFLTFFIVVLTGLQIYTQYDISQSINPKIESDINIELHHPTINLYNSIGIEKNKKGEFELKKGYLNLEITNLGLKDTNYMNFYIKDPEGEYESPQMSLDNIESLQNKFLQIPILNINCSRTYSNALLENKGFEWIWKECRAYQESLKPNKKELLLKVDCPGCFTEKNSQCYSLDICIYKSNKSFCGDEKYSNLREINCLDDW